MSWLKDELWRPSEVAEAKEEQMSRQCNGPAGDEGREMEGCLTCCTTSKEGGDEASEGS